MVKENTLKKYCDSIAEEVMQPTLWDKIFPKQYRKRREVFNERVYMAAENVAQSYHKIAVQNFEILLLGRCMNAEGKITKKVGKKDIVELKEQLERKFKA